jgi:anti-sigma factor RsiW
VTTSVDALVALVVEELALRRRNARCDAELSIATLLGLVADELPGAEAEALRRHLADCVTCLNAFAALRAESGRLESAARRNAARQRSRQELAGGPTRAPAPWPVLQCAPADLGSSASRRGAAAPLRDGWHDSGHRLPACSRGGQRVPDPRAWRADREGWMTAD